MHKRMTITLDEPLYEGLHRRSGKRRISQFIEDLARPYVLDSSLDEGYRRWRPMLNAKLRQWSGAMPWRRMSPMRRGEVWWAEFDPSIGNEIRKSDRP